MMRVALPHCAPSTNIIGDIKCEALASSRKTFLPTFWNAGVKSWGTF
jgi:hypothetical protein